jgi:RND family efflux transporter MFP subunit
MINKATSRITSLLLIFTASALAQQPPALVVTATVESMELAPTREVAAYTKARYITEIKVETEGRVMAIADVGSVVPAGESLGLIADENYSLRLTELNNVIKSQQANLEFLQSEAERLASLQAQNLTSKTSIDKNNADLKTAKADLAQARSRYQQLTQDIERLNLTAPYDAIVTQQQAQPGQWLNAGEPFVQLMSADQTEIIAQVPLRLKQHIITGHQWAYQTLEGQQGQARVTGFIPAATTNSRQIQVHLEDISDLLIPGEPIKLAAPEALPEAHLVVPRDALVLRGTGIHVFVIRDDVAHQVMVTPGLAQGDVIAVNGELSAGDVVVIRGNERLRDQQPVTIKP